MIWVGLPAYNESHRITNLLTDIHKSLNKVTDEYKIIVYDDGSTDDTASKVLSAGKQGIKVYLVTGVKNKGLGYALSYLIEHFASLCSLEDIVITMDADATHNPEHIHRMTGFINDGFDIVIASRYTPYSRIIGLELRRRILSNVANFMFKLLFPIKGVRDYTCAYRAYTAKILKLARDVYKDRIIEERGFACMAEFLIKLRRLGIIACEVPLILKYDKKAGPTKMKVMLTMFRTFILVIRSFFLRKIPYEENQRLRKRYEL